MDRAFLRASLLGAAAALVLFVGLLTYGRGALLAEDQLGGFYEAQTRALFDGHLDVDPDAVTFEGFRVGDRTYIYQGPVPALLRMPVMAVTDRFDGRLTRISMLAAYLLALGAIIRLGWRVRVLVRGAGPVGRFEAASAGIVTFGAGASTLLFLGAQAVGVPRGAALGRRARPGLLRRARPLVGRARPEAGAAWRGPPAWPARRCCPDPRWAQVRCVALGLVGLRELVRLRTPEARTPQAWARVAGLLLGRAAAAGGLRRDQPGEVRFPVRAADRRSRSWCRSIPPGRPRSRRTTARCSASSSRRRSPGRRCGPTGWRRGACSPSSGSRPTARPRWATWCSPSGTGRRACPASEPLLVVLGLIGVVALVVPDRMAPGAAVRVLRLPVARCRGRGRRGAGPRLHGEPLPVRPDPPPRAHRDARRRGGGRVGGGTEPAGPGRRAGRARGARPLGGVGEHVARAPVPAGDRARGAGRLAGVVARVAGAARSRPAVHAAAAGGPAAAVRPGRPGRRDRRLRRRVPEHRWWTGSPSRADPETGRFDLDVTASAATEGFVSLVGGAGGERPDSPRRGHRPRADVRRPVRARRLVEGRRPGGEAGARRRVDRPASGCVTPPPRSSSTGASATSRWSTSTTATCCSRWPSICPHVRLRRVPSGTFDAVLRPASQRACHAIGAG